MRHGTCLVCGVEFSYEYEGGRLRRYCDAHKKPAYPYSGPAEVFVRSCLTCGVSFTSNQPKQVSCSRKCWRARRPPRAQQHRRVVGFRSCLCCGRLFCVKATTGSKNQKYCSRPCASSRSRPCASLCPQIPSRAPLKQCVWCGVSSKNNTCSDECAASWKRFVHPKWLNFKRIYWKTCPWCKSLHYTTRKNGRSSCTVECAEMVVEALGTDGKWSWITRDRRWSIYARDRETCQICGDHVPMQYAGTAHMLAPTLDHIVPRSMGGTHDDDNLRLAHFICNSLRGDRVHEQLSFSVA